MSKLSRDTMESSYSPLSERYPAFPPPMEVESEAPVNDDFLTEAQIADINKNNVNPVLDPRGQYIPMSKLPAMRIQTPKAQGGLRSFIKGLRQGSAGGGPSTKKKSSFSGSSPPTPKKNKVKRVKRNQTMRVNKLWPAGKARIRKIGKKASATESSVVKSTFQTFRTEEAVPEQHPDFQKISVEKFREILSDYFKYVDPLKTEREIDTIVHYTTMNGINKVNAKLKKRYNQGLEVKQKPQYNGAGSKPKPALIVQNHGRIRTEVYQRNSLNTAGLKQHTTAKFDGVTRMQLEKIIQVLNRAESPEHIKTGVIDFYTIAAPEKMAQWHRHETHDFIGEILSWTFRFGLQSLCDNLREQFLASKTPRKPPALPSRKRGEQQALDEKWQDEHYIKEILFKFYTIYNPARLEAALDDLIDYIQRKGVERFNQKLRKTYNADLFTFKEANDLMDKLYSFFSIVDNNMIIKGLDVIEAWAQRHDRETLNKELKKRYGCDLDSYLDGIV